MTPERKYRWYKVEILDGDRERHRTVKIAMDGQGTLEDSIRRKLPQNLRNKTLLQWYVVGSNYLY